MKSETKDTTLVILFGVLVVFNMLAIGLSIGSCVCSIDNAVCYERCEQKSGINHIVSFIVNIISFIAVSILIWIWSDKKRCI